MVAQVGRMTGGRQELARIARVMALALLLYLGVVAGERHVLATHLAVTEQHTVETRTTQESAGEAGGAEAHTSEAGHELVLGIAVDDPAVTQRLWKYAGTLPADLSRCERWRVPRNSWTASAQPSHV
jgi:hypothetical protein